MMYGENILFKLFNKIAVTIEFVKINLYSVDLSNLNSELIGKRTFLESFKEYI